MASRLPTSVFRDGLSGTAISTDTLSEPLRQEHGLLRVLVLDDHQQTVEQIENALWVWPHRVTRTNCVSEAVNLCQHLTPAALIVSLETEANIDGQLISAIRHVLPRIPVVAVANSEDAADPGAILKQGASAVLNRETLQQPTLYDLLMRLQMPTGRSQPSMAPDEIEMPFPWCDSVMFGSLICDVSGQVVCANHCLARILGYQAPDDLSGLSVPNDILCESEEWASWKSVAGDTSKVNQQSTSIRAKNQQLLFMSIETFALAQSPTKIQAVFVDLSNLTHQLSKNV